MALTSPNMGLRIWTATADRYDHDQAAANFAKIDYHDHTPGRGIQIPTEALYDGAVNYAKTSRSFIQSTVYSAAPIPANSSVQFTIPWPTAWIDTNYQAFITMHGGVNWLLRDFIYLKNTNNLIVEVRNDSGSTATGLAIQALGIHQ